jgi:hypothetical protein
LHTLHSPYPFFTPGRSVYLSYLNTGLFRTGGGLLYTYKIACPLKSIKRLLSFAQRIGSILFNVGAMVKVPKFKKTLMERIMTEEQVFTQLAKETNRRNHAL